MRLTRTRTSLVAAASLALLATGGAGLAMAAGDAKPNPVTATSKAPAKAPSKVVDKASLLAALPGGELKFVSLDPCRIIDTRIVGGAITNNIRHFNGYGSFATQGGSSTGCGVPRYAKALQINLGAISQGGASGYLKGWAFGSPEPLASLVNYNKSGPIANMVSLKVSGGNPSFTVRAVGSAHVYADVAGYFVSPPYVAVDPSGNIYQGISSGVVSVSKVGTGRYDVTFDRDVTKCAALGTSIQWATNSEVSADVSLGGGKVGVGIASPSNTMTDQWFTLSLDC